jgi:UDP-3-O-[3-hydroxymyristoyl] glucosamine N-acyltransferase
MKGLAVPNQNTQLVFLENPRLAFVHFVNKVKNQSPAGAQRATIGDNCRIGELAVVGGNCTIGNDVVIEARVSLKNCRIGDGCVIQSGTSIGSDGFAYERYPDGRLERFPHLGQVILGKNVEVSANCSIARGSLGDTVIGDGTKLDALVHVAHNVQIGRDCQLAAGTIIGGSTTVGDSCWTGLNSTLKNQIRVGSYVLVAAGACVIGDVPDNDVVAGVPAKSIKDKVKTDELFIMTGRKSVEPGPPAIGR